MSKRNKIFALLLMAILLVACAGGAKKRETEKEAIKIFSLIQGDGRLGYKADRQYNAIHVGAAAEKIPDAVRSIVHF